jgi:hypothetical protein
VEPYILFDIDIGFLQIEAVFLCVDAISRDIVVSDLAVTWRVIVTRRVVSLRVRV